jgi:protein translocase SecG subunit
MTFLVGVLYVLFMLLCVFLILVVLIQPPRGEGLASAFSGVGSESFLGARAYTQIQWITAGVAVVLVLIGLLINRLSHPGNAHEETSDQPPAAEEPAGGGESDR